MKKERIEFLRTLSEPWRYATDQDILDICTIAINGLEAESKLATALECLEAARQSLVWYSTQDYYDGGMYTVDAQNAIDTLAYLEEKLNESKS